MKKWKEFEFLSHKILKEVSPNADVKLDDKIKGTLSGKNRQIDVSIKTDQVLTIVQAKDYSVPADVNTVGEFSSVIQDVKATKGILICSSGFTSTAINYAKNLGILLINIHNAQSRDWNLDISIPIIWKETELNNVRINGFLRPEIDFIVKNNNGGYIDFYDMKSKKKLIFWKISKSDGIMQSLKGSITL